MLLALVNGMLVWGWGLALGAWAYACLGKPRGGQSPLVWLCLGWALQSWLSAIWSLIAPVNPALMAICWTLLAGLAIWRQWPYWKGQWSAWRKEPAAMRWYVAVGPALILVAGVGLAARPGKIFDEGLYYTQFIRWMQQYGTVPGLGNLHSRLGFNSHWHLLQAALAWPGQQQHDLNAQLWMLMSFTGFWQLGRALRRPRASLSLYWVCILLLSPLWLNFLTAPSADFSLAVLTCLMAWLFLRGASVKFLWLIALWALTIKLSGALLLAFPLLAWWKSGEKGRAQLIWLCVTGGLYVLPWLLRNAMLSGYLVYPVSLTALGLDWQVPLQEAARDVHAIRAWARLPGGADYWLTLEQPISVWLPNWWSVQVIEQQIGLLAGLGISLWLLVTSLVSMLRKKPLSRWDWTLWVLLLNGIFWFVQAPDPRFGLGAIWGMLLITGARYLVLKHRIARAVCIGLVLLTQAMMLRSWDQALSYPIESAPFRRPLIESVPVRDGEIWLSQDPNGCFDAELPCTHEDPRGKGLQWRGTSLQEGFRKGSLEPAAKP